MSIESLKKEGDKLCKTTIFLSKFNILKHKKICRFCKKEFLSPYWKSIGGYRKYCNRKCWQLDGVNRKPNLGKHWKHTQEYKDKLSLARTGSKNPMFISGDSKYRKENRKIKYWRISVFERDNYTCKMCNKRGCVNLNAHHIIPYSLCVEKRLDINNGITLCIDCHKKVHKSKQND